MRTIVLTRGRRFGSRRKPCHWLGKDGVLLLFRTRQGARHVVGMAGVGYSLVPYVVDLSRELLSERDAVLKRMKVMKRKTGKAQSGDLMHLAPMESRLFDELPGIVKHCAEVKYDDGGDRQAGWITIKTMGSAWVVEAKDPDTCSRLCVIQATLDDALSLVSVLLESDEAPWEKDKWMQQQAAKNTKKK